MKDGIIKTFFINRFSPTSREENGNIALVEFVEYAQQLNHDSYKKVLEEISDLLDAKDEEDFLLGVSLTNLLKIKVNREKLIREKEKIKKKCSTFPDYYILFIESALRNLI